MKGDVNIEYEVKREVKTKQNETNNLQHIIPFSYCGFKI